MDDNSNDIDTYGGDEVREYRNKPVPQFLKFVYFVLPFWGALWFYLFWNGSAGWLDRGGWSELQRVANTRAVIEEPAGHSAHSLP
jgi:hypothetical protein